MGEETREDSIFSSGYIAAFGQRIDNCLSFLALALKTSQMTCTVAFHPVCVKP